MEEKETDDILLFDTLYTTNHMQILKILLPYLKEDLRHMLAVYIKLMELKYTLACIKKSKKNAPSDQEENSRPLDLSVFCHKISPYCTQDEQNLMNHLENAWSGMEKYQEIMKIMQVMEPLSNPDADNMDLNELLKNVLSKEQAAMFQMFQEEI